MKLFLLRLIRPIEWSLLTKLLVTFGFLAIIPLVVLSLYSYDVSRQTALQIQTQALISHTNDLAARLDILLIERQQNTRHLAEDRFVKTFSVAWPHILPEVRKEAQNELQNLVNTNPNFDLVLLLNQEGLVILSTTEEIGRDYSLRPYFQQAITGNAYISDISISADLGKPVIYFSAPIRDDDHQVVAVAVLRVLAEEIWSQVVAEKRQLGPGSAAILFDEYGIRLAHSSDSSLVFKAVVPLDPQIEAQLLAQRHLGDRGKIESTNLPELAEGLRQAESQPYFTYHLPVGNELFHAGAVRLTVKPWTVVESVPESAFLTPVREMIAKTRFGIAAIALLFTIVSVWATWWIIHPVRELTTAAQKLAEGKLDHTITTFRMQRGDEIGRLIQSFETMRLGLQESYAELEASNLRLRRLYELAMALSGDVTDVAHQVVNIITELLGVKVATVAEIRQDQIIVIAMNDHNRIIREEVFPLQGTPCAAVHAVKDVCIFTGAVEKFPEASFLVERNLNTYIGVPILDSQGETFGVVNAMDDRPRDFNDEDISLLQTLAKRLSLEFEQSRAREELQQSANLLRSISSAQAAYISRTDQHLLFDKLLDDLLLLTQSEYGIIGEVFYTSDGDPYLKTYAATNGMEFYNLNTLFGAVITTGETVIANDPAMDPRSGGLPEGHPHINAFLGLPFYSGDELVGMVGIANRPGGYDEQLVNYLYPFLATCANIIQAHRTNQQRRQREGELLAIAEVGGLVTAGGELKTTLDTLAEKIAQVADFDAVGIGLYHAEEEKISFPAFYTTRPMKLLKAREGAVARLGETPVLQQLLREKQHIYFADPQNDARIRESQRTLVREDGIQAILTWPLLFGGELIGTLDLVSTHARSFTPEDLSLLSTLADQTSAAVQNARLFREAQRRNQLMTRLAAISEELNRIYSISQVTAAIGEGARTICERDRVAVYLRQPDDSIISTWSQGLSSSYIQQIISRFDEMPGFEFREQTDPILIPDTSHLPNGEILRDLSTAEGYQAVALWPLVFEGRTIAAVGVYSDSPHFWSTAEQEVMMAFSRQAAVAITNARLFDEGQQHLRERTTLLELSAQLRSLLRKEDMLSPIIECTTEGLDVECAIVFTLESRTNKILVQKTDGECDDNLPGRTFSLEDMPTTCTMRNGQPCFGQDDCPFFPDSGQSSQLACIPFKTDDRILGALHVRTHRPEGFREEHIRLLSGIADIAANSLRRAEFFEEVRLYKDAFNSTADAIAITNLDSHILDVNPAFERITGYSREEALGQKPSLLKSRHSTPEFYQQLWSQILNQGYWSGEIINQRKDGEEWYSHLTISTVNDERGQPVAYLGIQQDITERKRLEQANITQLKHLNALFGAAQQLAVSLDDKQLTESIVKTCVESFGAKLAWLGLAEPDGSVQLWAHYPADNAYLQGIQMRWDDTAEGSNPFGQAIRKGFPVVIQDSENDERFAPWREAAQAHGYSAIASFPLISGDEVIGALNLYSDDSEFFTPGQIETFQTLTHQATAALKNARLFSETQQRLRELETLYTLLTQLRTVQNMDEMFTLLLVEVRQRFKADAGLVVLRDKDGEHFAIAQADGPLTPNRGRVFNASDGISEQVLQTRAPYCCDDYAADPLGLDLAGAAELGPTAFVPMESEEALMGVLMVARKRGSQAQPYTAEEVRLLAGIGEMAGNNLRRLELYEDAMRRLKRVQALRNIDLAITGSLDPQVTLRVLLDEVTKQLEIDAAAVLLLDSESLTLRHAASRGFHSDMVEHTSLHLGEGYAGRAALERRSIAVETVSHNEDAKRLALWKVEGFVSHYAAPLIAKDQVLGVLETFHRSTRGFDQEWLEFLEALAGQAALALENAGLYQELQAYTNELEQRVAERTNQIQAANEQLRQAHEEVIQALEREKELNALKTRFISMVSHEFRTPLTTILSSAELLEHYSYRWPEEKKLNHLHRIQSTTQRMAALLDDVLLVGRIETDRLEFNPQLLDLVSICQELIEEFQHGVGAQHHLVLDLSALEDPNTLPAQMDEQLLLHILNNLLSNAIKYSPPGSPVQLILRRQEERVVFEVIDQGIGIPLQDQAHLFESFYRASNVGSIPGTGLGLNIVQRAVELHGGNISILTEEDNGTTVLVELPLGATNNIQE